MIRKETDSTSIHSCQYPLSPLTSSIENYRNTGYDRTVTGETEIQKKTQSACNSPLVASIKLSRRPASLLEHVHVVSEGDAVLHSEHFEQLLLAVTNLCVQREV